MTEASCIWIWEGYGVMGVFMGHMLHAIFISTPHRKRG